MTMPRKAIDPKVLEILQNMTQEPSDERDDEPAGTASIVALVSELRALFEHFSNGREQALRPGMLAVWKPGLKNRRFPAYGEPVIVVALREPPATDSERDSGIPYFEEPLDLLLGTVRDGDFLVYHVDRRRFEPYDKA
jgi:hypothetical protein